MGRGRYVLADEIGTDGQLAMAAVNEDGQLDGLGTPHIDEGVESRADRAPCIEHIIDEHHSLARDIHRQFRRMDDGLVRER